MLGCPRSKWWVGEDYHRGAHVEDNDLGIDASSYLQPALMKYSTLLDHGAAHGYGSCVPGVGEDPHLEYVLPGCHVLMQRTGNLFLLESDQLINRRVVETWRHALLQVLLRLRETVGPCNSSPLVRHGVGVGAPSVQSDRGVEGRGTCPLVGGRSPE